MGRKSSVARNGDDMTDRHIMTPDEAAQLPMPEGCELTYSGRDHEWLYSGEGGSCTGLAILAATVADGYFSLDVLDHAWAAAGGRAVVVIHDETRIARLAEELTAARRQLERACKERDSAEAERDRLQRLFDDAGGEEYNVLALVDHYQSDWFRMEKELLDAQKALADRKTVEEWLQARDYGLRIEGDGGDVKLIIDDFSGGLRIERFGSHDLAYAAAAEWVRGQGRLVWYCDKCGTPEPAEPEYKHGDSEPCCLCEDGTARVMTRHEAMARGVKP